MRTAIIIDGIKNKLESIRLNIAESQRKMEALETTLQIFLADMPEERQEIDKPDRPIAISERIYQVLNKPVISLLLVAKLPDYFH